ncbi:MAG: hypothetical protein LBE56_01925 [Tannerella sp.]|nr:hypothetical protein [Tannerella sp.]
MDVQHIQWFRLMLAFLGIWFVSCTKDAVEPPDEAQPDEIRLKVNKFVYAYMQERYLWTSSIDWSQLDPDNDSDPIDFFEKMRYRPTDKWSLLSDKGEKVLNQVNGIVTSYGYELTWITLQGYNTMFAIVLYVFPNSPAERAGFKRGDFIVSLNSSVPNITEDNYRDLYDAPSISVGKANIAADGSLEINPNLVNMTAITLYQDPVFKDTLIVKDNHRIGYLLYTDYIFDSEQRLVEVLSGFKERGVTDVVLDLRYNRGGFAETATKLSSMLAPAAVVQRKDIFLIHKWNDDYMKYYASINYDPNEYFIDSLSVNMNLSRLYVLTLPSTTSASEGTMIGLAPYMDVIQIGEETAGKYYGGLLNTALSFDEKINGWLPDASIENWILYMLVYRYADRTGDTSFSSGLVPDFYVEEDYGRTLPPIGDERDPLLGKAIELITGQPVSTRSATPSLRLPYKINGMLPRSPLNGKMISESKNLGLFHE